MKNEMVVFEDVVKVHSMVVGGIKQDTMNARDLYLFLRPIQSGTHFTEWVERRITEYDFVDDEDFVCLLPSSGKQKGSGGHNKKEYFLTIDAVKEFGLLEASEIGKKVRRYLIACEKELKRYKSPETSIVTLGKDFKLAVAMTKSLGFSGADAKQKARDFMLEQTSVDCFVLFPGVQAEIEFKQNNFTIVQAAVELDMRVELIKVLLDKNGVYYRREGRGQGFTIGTRSPGYVTLSNPHSNKPLLSKLALKMLLEYKGSGYTFGLWDFKSHKSFRELREEQNLIEM